MQRFNSLLVLFIIPMAIYSTSCAGAVTATFINNSVVLLDERVSENYGSWDGEYNLYDPKTVILVYDELQKILAKQQRVILLDIGANTGSFALLPMLCDKIKVFAFEPNLKVADILRSNVELNNISDNVSIIPIGVSDRNAILNLHIPAYRSSGLATFSENVLRFDANAGYTYAALVKPIDDLTNILLSANEKIDVIKIDTEGWDYYVLLGARKTLVTHRPILLLEFNETNMKQAGVNPEDVKALLAELNYNCEFLGDDLFCQPHG